MLCFGVADISWILFLYRSNPSVGGGELYLRIADAPVLPTDGTEGQFDCGPSTNDNPTYCELTWDGNGAPSRQTVYAALTGYDAAANGMSTC